MKTSLLNSYRLWAIAALFYFFQFILRLSPSVMMPDLMQAFSIDATGFAALGSIALISYSLFQIPLGAFADRFGVRKCILVFLSLCIFGTFLFATTSHLWVAQIGRFIIGMGSAAAFICVSKTINQLFPIEKRSTMFGLTMVVGTFGALNGGVPLCLLLEHVGWSHCLLTLCLLGLVLVGVTFATLKMPKRDDASEKITMRQSLKLVFMNKDCWIYAGTAIGLYLCICVLGDLWGVAYVMSTHEVERSLAVQVISSLYVGLCTGSLMITWFSDRIQKSKSLIIFSSFMLILLMTLILLPIHIPFIYLYPIFFLLGFFAGAELLCFSGICKIVPSSVSGMTTGFLNGLVMMTGAFIQMCVGIILDARWDGMYGTEGIKLYQAADYRIALSLILPVLFITFFSSLFIKEKKDQHYALKEI